MAMAGAGRDSAVRLLWRRVLIAVLIVAVFMAGWAAWGMYRKERESGALRQQAEARFADLESRHAKLVADVARLRSERGKEQALRNAYDVGREGERLIVIVEPPVPQARATSTRWYERIQWWR